MRVRPVSYAGREIDAATIVPLRATGRNEPVTFELAARDTTVSALHRSAQSHHACHRRTMRRQRAFTLVEILVALAILAIALTAGMRALAQATDTATALKARTLALWVAQNRLAAAQIARPGPRSAATKARPSRPTRNSGGRRTSPPRPIRNSAASTSRSASRSRPTTRSPRSPAFSVIRSRGSELRLAARGARGFTLVEALLALLIFGVVSLLAYRATAALAAGEAQLSAESQRWRTLETLFTRIEADFRQAIPRACAMAAARGRVARHARRQCSAVVFTRAGSEFTAEPGLAGQRVGYRLREGTLELAYWPALDHARRAARGVSAGARHRSFDLEYLARNGTWRERWPLLGEDDLPRAARLTLTLADGVRIERMFALR